MNPVEPSSLLSPLPFDRRRIAAGIVHIGLGGFHRAHMARFTHDLMAEDETASGWGILGVGLLDADASLIAVLNDQDGLYTLIEREGGSETATVIGSLLRAIDASISSTEALAALDDTAVRIVSLTVTEHGYCLDRATKRLDLRHPGIAHDIAHPDDPRTAIGLIVEALRRRRGAGRPGFTALSCDNIQRNGDVLRHAVTTLAATRDPGLAAWIERACSFPSGMVDRITPMPTTAGTRAIQERYGIADGAPLVAEAFRQWVVEDRFVAGRPAWEKVGVQFVADVAPYEKMKLRLLNASHLAMSGLGALAGHAMIADTMSDPLIARYVSAVMDRELAPTLDPVPGVDLAAYQLRLIARFGNAAIPDTVRRVNKDAALNYLLDPIRDRLAAGAPLPLLALALSAWLRRVRGEDEAGNRVIVDHPMAPLLREKAISGGSDPADLLSIGPLFGELGAVPALHEAVAPWLRSLYDKGAIATLQAAAIDNLI
jgi:mannitol 2-dehydrogenase